MTNDFDDWIFYDKSGLTERTRLRALLSSVTYTGRDQKTLSFVLEARTDFVKFMQLTASAIPDFTRKSVLRGCRLYTDTSTDQANTIKIEDPTGLETGFYLMVAVTPVRKITLKNSYEVSMILTEIGAVAPTELADGIFVVYG